MASLEAILAQSSLDDDEDLDLDTEGLSLEAILGQDSGSDEDGGPVKSSGPLFLSQQAKYLVIAAMF